MSSFLFVPANRPERFIKACQTGANAVILDLEDTVSYEEKTVARQNICQFDFNRHKSFDTQELWLRINNNDELNQDLQFISTYTDLPIRTLLIPKAETAERLGAIFEKTNLPLIPLIETAQGLNNAQAIASTKGVYALSFGLLDLGRAFGVSFDSEGANIFFNQVRYQLLLASTLFGLHKPIETIYKDFKNTDGFLANAALAYQMGFGGQLCIHPSQVTLAHIAYRPSDDQLELAKQIVSHFETTNDYAFSIQGMMVDLPLIDWARGLLRQPATSNQI